MKTIRQQIIAILEENEMTAMELSKELKIREKEVYEHLLHINKSLKPLKKKLIVDPFRCLICGFVFENRKRYTRPGRCPQCKQGSLDPALYKII